MTTSNSEESTDLYSSDKCLVGKAGGIVWLRWYPASWSPAAAKLARRFKVNGLALCLPGKGQSLDFLSQFPQLRALELSGGTALPWNAIECLSELKSVTLLCDDGESPVEIDFTRFKKLTECSLSWKRAWASVLQVKGIRELLVSESDEVRELDCTAMKRLERLITLGCTSLKTITLNESAKLRLLRINNSPKLTLDWKRVGRDLEHFTVIGRLASPLEDLRQAKELVRLELIDVGRIKSLDFLRDLPKLYVVETDSTLSKADVALRDAINEKAISDWEKKKKRMRK